MRKADWTIDISDKDFHDLNMLGLIPWSNSHSGRACIWLKDAPTPIDKAKRLRDAGWLFLEDSPRGPMVTRTYMLDVALDHKKEASDG